MAPSAPQQQGILLTQAASASLINDIDVTITNALFCAWDYNGNIDHEILALGVTFEDENGVTHDQYYSAGELTYFVPSTDGTMLVPVADKQMLNDNCNCWKFINSLLECGFPAETLGNNISSIVGMKVHVLQQAQPKRTGLIRGGKNPDREPTVLLVSQILEMPGQATQTAKKPAAKPAPGKAPTGKPATVAAKPANKPAVAAKPGAPKPNGAAGPSTTSAGDDEKAVAVEILTGILAESGGTIAKKALAGAAFKAAGAKVTEGVIDAKTKNKIVQLLFQDSFLHELAGEGQITYDGNEVALAA